MSDKQSPETEARILDAAHRVFTRKGTAGARMQDIADEAGVNQALLHYYFRSKDRLATAVFTRVATQLMPTIAATLASDAPLTAKIEGVVHAYIDTIRERPFLPAYLISELHHHPERLLTLLEQSLPAPPATMAAGLLARVQAQLDAEAAAGRMRPFTAHHLILNTIGLCVFPFLVQPLLRAGLAMDEGEFARFLDQRRRELPGFILNALRP